MTHRLCLWWAVALAVISGCAKQQTRPADDVPPVDLPPTATVVARPLPLVRLMTAPPAARAAPVDAGSPAPMECGAEPCCGDPPQPCGTWIAEQRARNGAIVVEQVPTAECAVFLDGQEWPEGRTFRAFKFVAPGMHTVECRSSSGVLFSRTVEVELGKDTPVYWGP